jgi:two-component system, OmpR family, phosphate regulon sensor histidine kinase PhoR
MMTNAIIRRVIILGAIAIGSLLAVQTYWILLTYDLQEREFTRKVYQALLDTAHKLSFTASPPFQLPSQNLIVQPYANYYVVNINNQFKTGDLEHYLGESLEAQGLREDFHYGMFDCSSNQMVAGKIIHFADHGFVYSDDQTMAASLPALNNADFIYYFGVRFPEKSANLLSNMAVVVVFSLLMLVTIAFFIYAMTVILRQKQLSEQQRDFINNMTHEFKTPISTINISTDVFLQSSSIKTDLRLNRYAKIIKEQVLRLNTQVEKVLQLAKIEKDNLELNKERLDLEELINSLSPSLELKTGEKEGRIQLHLGMPHPIVMADRLHLTNILHNLVDNAVKYSRQGVPPEIIIALFKSKKGVTLKVTDNGLGISKEHQKRVFDKFYRVSTGNVHNVKGFGLGLFYVKEICKQHGWVINLYSELGKGTAVEIIFPVE